MLGQLLQHALVAIRSGWRGHSFRVIFLFGCVLVSGSYLAASFSGRQPITVAMDVGISGIRLIVTLMALFWVQDLIAKDIDRKNLLWVLAYPAPRASYLLGRFLGVAFLSSIAVAVLGLFLLILVRHTGLGYLPTVRLDTGTPYLLTLILLLLDIWVITAFSIWVAMYSTSAIMPLAVGVCFAIAARSLGSVIAYLLSPDAQASPIIVVAVNRIQWIVPDLSRLDIRDYCLYGVVPSPHVLNNSIVMAGAYLAILLILGCWQINRRELA